MDKVYIVQSEHWYQPGLHFNVCATRERAVQQAIADLKILIDDLRELRDEPGDSWDKNLDQPITPENWEELEDRARMVRAKNLGCDVDDLKEDDGWVAITEHEVLT